MRERAVLTEPYAMESSFDQCKGQEMCAKAFERTPKMPENFDNDDLITWRNAVNSSRHGRNR